MKIEWKMVLTVLLGAILVFCQCSAGGSDSSSGSLSDDDSDDDSGADDAADDDTDADDDVADDTADDDTGDDTLADDTLADDTADDDTGDDDITHPCGDYDVLMEGTYEGDISTWQISLVFEAGNALSGLFLPVGTDIPEFEIVGELAAPDFWVEGSYPTPPSGQGACPDSDFMFSHVDFTVDGSDLTGVISIYCGTDDTGDFVWDAVVDGNVTCGEF